MMIAGPNRDHFPLFRLIVISGAIFVAVSTEFLPTGLLPEIAIGLSVSESQVGLLVTLFALTVVLTAAPLTAVTQRYSRKSMMVVTLAVLAVSTVLAAAAPNYASLAAARVVGGLANGLFWSVTGPYAARIVAPRQLSRAIAVTASGGSAAFIFGVPLGTALGHDLGWRAAFLVMGAAVLAFMSLAIVALPAVNHRVVPLTAGAEYSIRRDRTLPAILIVGVTIILFNLGQNSFYTYLVPWSTEVANIPAASVGAVLFGFGAAGAVGLLLAGMFGDRYPRASIVVMAGTVLVAVGVLGAFGAGLSVPAVVTTLVVWGIAFGGIPPLLQTRVLQAASIRARDVASSWTTISFNLSIGGGAFLGGLLLDRIGITVLPWVEFIIIALGLFVVLLTDRRRLAFQHPAERDPAALAESATALKSVSFDAPPDDSDELKPT